MTTNKATETTEARKWTMSDGSGSYTETILADTLADALADAADWAREGDYGDLAETLWVTVYVRCEATGESDSVRVEIDPEEPACDGPEHDWRDYAVVGHGGGVVCTDRCHHCGLLRTVDTWAQDRSSGEQGLHSVSYEEPVA